MSEKSFIIKGDICFSVDSRELLCFKDHFLVCDGGISAGVFKDLPEEYNRLQLFDYSGLMVIPGLVDLHIHAPQYSFRGLGMDYELLDWLKIQTFPEEGRYSDIGYAKEAYSAFAEAMKRSATTRACIYGTTHVPATELLMELMDNTGLKTFVGKLNMDRNVPDYIVEKSAEASAAATREWLDSCIGRYANTKPILTPRFIPTCSDELLKELRDIQKEYKLPLQSHISENLAEIEWVKELCPDAEFYGDAYDRQGLFGKDVPTIMAHCVYSDDRELARIKKNGVFVAHCPQSNANLASGIAPVRKFLDMQLRCGLGSDVAGSTSASIFHAMSDAVQMSKIRWRLVDNKLKPLTFEEAFFLGTKGGGEFFGKVGSFEKGYEFDAVVINDKMPSLLNHLTLKQRLERLVYLTDSSETVHKFVSGEQIF